jgi:hypothetical protein
MARLDDIPEQVLRGTQNAADITVGRPSRGSWRLCSRRDLLTSELPASVRRRATGLST